MTWFAVFSVGGWAYETVFAAVRRGRWENRGFLFGPVCPIYGTGAVGCMILFDHPAVADGSFPWWGVFLISMVLSAVLELTTSIVLEKRFHARWWDYSNLPLNFQGRICVWPAMLFGGGGLAICFLLLPPIKEITLATPQWFWELSSLVVTAVISADTVLTVDALNDLSTKLEESSQMFDERMELRVASAHESASNAAAKVTETATNAAAKVSETASSAAAKVTETATNAAVKVSETASSAAAKVTETASNAAAKVTSLPEAAAARMESFGESIEQAQLEAKEAAAQERSRQEALLAEALAEQAAREEKARMEAAAREEQERRDRELREKARMEAAAREEQELHDRETAGRLNFRQRYALRNIRAYDSEKTNRSAGRLRTFIAKHESPAVAIREAYAEAVRGRGK